MRSLELVRNDLFEASESLPADRHPVAVYLINLRSDGSRRVQLSALRRIAELLGKDIDRLTWHKLRYQHVAAIAGRLAEDYSPSTANRMLSALKGVVKQAWLLGLMSADEYHRCLEVKGVSEQRESGRALSVGEVRALFESCRTDLKPSGLRDGAILSLLLAAGLRRAEAVNLNIEDYDIDTGSILVRRGKRRKDRTVYVNNGAKDWIDAWLKVQEGEQGPMFPPINKGGRLGSRRLSTEAIYRILDKRAKEAGISDLSPHTLRRTFATWLLNEGADLSVVSRLMGHSSLETTKRYDRRGEEAKRQASGLLHLPGPTSQGAVSPSSGYSELSKDEDMCLQVDRSFLLGIVAFSGGGSPNRITYFFIKNDSRGTACFLDPTFVYENSSFRTFSQSDLRVNSLNK